MPMAQNIFEELYVRTLDKPYRDLEGKRLDLPKKVIVDPKIGLVDYKIMAYTDANKNRFEENNYCWTIESRINTWYPSLTDVPDKISTAQTARRNFTSAVNENLLAAGNSPLPDVNLSPWLYILPWMPKIRKVKELVDLTPKLVDRMIKIGGAPAPDYDSDPKLTPDKLPVPNEWRDLLTSLNEYKIYEISGFSANFHVVAAFVAPLAFSPGLTPQLVSATPGMVNAVISLYDDWKPKNEKPTFTFFTIGAATDWKQKSVTESGEYWLFLSSPNEGDSWTRIEPPSPPSSAKRNRYLLDFRDRLLPETNAMRIERIRNKIDEYGTEYKETLSVEKIAADTGYRPSVVYNAFVKIQNKEYPGGKRYQCYKTDNKKIAVNIVKPGDSHVKYKISDKPGFLKRHIIEILAAVVSVGIARFGIFVEKGTFNYWGLAIGIPLVYAAGCITKALRRNQFE